MKVCIYALSQVFFLFFEGGGRDLLTYFFGMIYPGTLDTNRESVVSQGFILPIIRQLQNDSLASLAIPVLYNICIDYGK